MSVFYNSNFRSLLAGSIVLAVACLCLMLMVIRLIAMSGSRSRYTMSQVDGMTGLEFEHYLALILNSQGYKGVRLTEKYDLGIDIVASKEGVLWGIQAKRYKGLVGINAVRQAVAALNIYNCDKAMVITNSYFSASATKLAESNDRQLVDRIKLAQMNNALHAPSLGS